MKRYVFFPVRVTLQEDNLYRVECITWENCWCDAATLEEALADIQDVIKLCLKSDGVSDKAISRLPCLTELPLSIALPIEVV